MEFAEIAEKPARERDNPADIVVSQATSPRRRRELCMARTAVGMKRRFLRSEAPRRLAAAQLICLMVGLQACKTYRVADGGDTGTNVEINDSGTGGSVVDAAMDQSVVDKPVVDNPIDAKADVAGQGPDVGTVCGSGTHICTGQCVSNTDVANCGMACVACPVPMGGSATCDGASCGGSCPTGFKLCAGQCIATAASCSGVCSREPPLARRPPTASPLVTEPAVASPATRVFICAERRASRIPASIAAALPAPPARRRRPTAPRLVTGPIVASVAVPASMFAAIPARPTPA
jgi:hypothetical protein